jgi:intracellular septation protein
MTEGRGGARRWISSLVDFGWPLGLVIGYVITRDMVLASWGLVAGAAIALVTGYILERRIAPMPLAAGVLALVFGLLTLVFHDPRFIYVKPTVTSLAFGGLLLGGLATGRNFLKMLLGSSLPLPDEGWRRLTLRYGVFFLVMAAVNEVIWRTQAEGVWLAFRFPGSSLIHVAFGLAQAPLILRYAQSEETPPPPVE